MSKRNNQKTAFIDSHQHPHCHPSSLSPYVNYPCSSPKPVCPRVHWSIYAKPRCCFHNSCSLLCNHFFLFQVIQISLLTCYYSYFKKIPLLTPYPPTSISPFFSLLFLAEKSPRKSCTSLLPRILFSHAISNSFELDLSPLHSTKPAIVKVPNDFHLLNSVTHQHYLTLEILSSALDTIVSWFCSKLISYSSQSPSNVSPP